MRANLDTKTALLAVVALGIVCAVRAEVAFTAWTVPAANGLSAEVKAVRAGGEWNIVVTAKNATATIMHFFIAISPVRRHSS